MKYYDHLIIGDGVAGATAAKTIREKDDEASIAVLTKEKNALYNRIMLKSYMKGDLPGVKFTRLHDENWYEKRDIDLELETEVVGVNRDKKEVETENTENYGYGRLLVATGGSPRKLPFDNSYSNLHYMWTLDDAERIKESAEGADKAVVIGGGLLGIDLAVAYAENGCETYYLIREENWWHRGLDLEGAEIVHRKLEGKGVEVLTDTEAVDMEGGEEVEKVVTDSGNSIECDAVAVAIGQTPNSEIVGVEKNESKMIRTDKYLRTSDQSIYAAGNLVEYYSPVLEERTVKGTWDHSEAMGRNAGKNMAGKEEEFDFINTYGVGHFDVQFLAIGDWSDESVEKKYSEDEYRRFFFKNDRIVGAVMIGFMKGQEEVKQIIQKKERIEDREEIWEKSFNCHD